MTMTITKKAIATFREMLRLEEGCDCQDGSCKACRAWWDEHRVLHAELGLRPWEYPAVEWPGSECPYPPNSPAAERWEPDLAAQSRWAQLERAAQGRSTTARAAHGAARRAARKAAKRRAKHREPALT